MLRPAYPPYSFAGIRATTRLSPNTGYSASGAERAFFPLYPLLCPVVSRVDGLSIWWNGLILSVTAFGAASAIFYAWVRCDHSRAVRLVATALLCFSPVSSTWLPFTPSLLPGCQASLAFTAPARLGSWPRHKADCLSPGSAYFIEIGSSAHFRRAHGVMAIAGALLAPLGALAYFNYLGRRMGFSAGMATYTALAQGRGWDTQNGLPCEFGDQRRERRLVRNQH